MVQRSNHRSKLAGAERAQRRAEGRRREILHAASKVFRQHGFAAASMRDIAAEADLSPGNLYYYFRSKQDLLHFCQDRTLDRLLFAVHSARGSGQPPAAQLESVVRQHLHIQLDELEGSSAHLELHALAPELRANYIAKRDRYEKGVTAIIRDGIGRGEFRAGDPKLLARALLGALNWTARWFNPEGAMSVDAVADAYAQYLVGGLVQSGAGASAVVSSGGKR